MFLLSCGRSSVGAEEVRRDDEYDSDRPRVAATVTPLDTRRGTGGSGVSFSGSGSGSRSDRIEGEVPMPSQRLDLSLSKYDSMATRLKTASRTDLSSLWSGREHTATTTSKDSKLLGRSSTDGEEIPIPDLYIGQYLSFCLPQTWSSVFASPGDFTLRVDSATEQSGELIVRIAVVCCSVRALKDATACDGTGATKRKSFVKVVERTERELVKFSETLALKYLGHRLTDRLPKLALSVLSSSKPQLEKYAEALTTFLSYVLTIAEIGYNRLVVISAPVAQNLIVREFFDLSLGCGDPNMVSTSSCDARLERRRASEKHPLLPTAWFNVIDGAHSKSFSLPGRDDSKPTGVRSPQQAPTPLPASSDGKCIRFIKPARWSEERSMPGAFTVELTSVTVAEGRAKYTISVLFYVRGRLQITTVDRRFSEFDSLVNRIEAKLRTLSVRNHFPTKTLFRYLSIGYLERRAAYLQRFLEQLLQMRFLGVLDQEITMVAEPNIRKFLSLPSVEWNITPWHVPRSPPPNRFTAQGAEYFDSPTARPYQSPNYTSSSNSNASGDVCVYQCGDPISPHYYTFSRRRSGSI